MKLLLDTHAWLWMVEGSAQLDRAARRALESPRNQAYLSPISIWEAHHIGLRKRLRMPGPFQEWLAAALARMPLLEAPFTFEVAIEVSRIHLPHADPGDTFLAATAVTFDLTLVTADTQLLGCKWLKTLAAD